MLRKLVRLLVTSTTLVDGLECFVPDSAGTGCVSCRTPDPSSSICGEPRVQSCNPTLESCCARWPVREHINMATCLEQFNDGHQVITPKKKCNPEICRLFVSKEGSFYNSDCIDECSAAMERKRDCLYDPESDNTLLRRCRYANHVVHGHHAVSVGTCFDNWVFGGPQNAFHVHEFASTPSFCQQICQDSEECARFTWSSEIVQNRTRDDDWFGRCLLHSQLQVMDALNAEVPHQRKYGADTGRLSQPDICQAGLAADHSELISWRCHTKPTCVLYSRTHIGGWKYCQQVNFCDLLQPQRTAAHRDFIEERVDLYEPLAKEPVTLTDRSRYVRFDVHPNGTVADQAISIPVTGTLLGRGVNTSLCDWKACRANASQGLVLKGKPLQQATVEIDFSHFPQVEVVGEVVSPAVVFEDRILVPPHVISPNQYTIAAPIFEVQNERVSPPIVFFGNVDPPAVLLGNKTLLSEEIDININKNTPTIIRLNEARASPLPVVLILQ